MNTPDNEIRPLAEGIYNYRKGLRFHNNDKENWDKGKELAVRLNTIALIVGVDKIKAWCETQGGKV